MRPVVVPLVRFTATNIVRCKQPYTHGPALATTRRCFRRPPIPWTRPFSQEAFVPQTRPGRTRRVLEASSFTAAILSAAAVAVTSAVFFYIGRRSEELESAFSEVADDTVNMAVDVPTGHPGNLTAEQEEKLRQFWAAVFRICNFDYGADEDEEGADGADGEDLDAATTNGKADGGKKKKKRGLFKRSKKDKNGATAEDTASVATKSSSQINVSTSPEEDKYGQGKVFQEALASMRPEDILDTIWSMVKHDNPDGLALRFLRARKWDLDRAVVMLISTIHWRLKDMHVDDDIVVNGELAAAEAEKDSSKPEEQAVARDFLEQIRMGKSYLHGLDKTGRPICVVRVRLHHANDQSEKSLERYTVYIIETARLFMNEGIETATIIFDMTNFSLANMDYTPVKFMIKCFEANYPECLGAVLVHKAPWIFQGIWRIIRGWLDPVVASKVHFTNNVRDMEQFLDKSHIIKELDGEESWQYKFVEPVPGENDKMKDEETREKLLAVRRGLFDEFAETTGAWIKHGTGEQAKALQAKREEIVKRLRDAYWKLDPYIRARTVYDRVGVIRPDGTLDPYVEGANMNGNGKA